MKHTHFVIYGPGNLGRLYAGGALRMGITVIPILRDQDPVEILASLPPKTPILIGVGEASLKETIESIPKNRRTDMILVQNELTPALLRDLKAEEATVAVVWTNVKPGIAVEAGRPTALFGPLSDFMLSIHKKLDLPATHLHAIEERDLELAAKAGFILTVNSLGVSDPITVGEWLNQAPLTVGSVLEDATTLTLLDFPGVDAATARQQICAGLQTLSALPSRGRSATKRLKAALKRADKAELKVVHLREIGKKLQHTKNIKTSHSIL